MLVSSCKDLGITCLLKTKPHINRISKMRVLCNVGTIRTDNISTIILFIDIKFSYFVCEILIMSNAY